MGRVAAIVTALAAGLGVSTALADEAGDVANHATELREQAVEAAKAKDFAACKAKAAEAWALLKNPVTAGLLGVCEAELGENRAAAEHLDYALRLDDDADRRALTRSKLDEVTKKIARVEITSEPSACDVTVDGEAHGKAPLTLFLDPGAHRIGAHRDGYEDSIVTVDLAGGDDKPLVVKVGQPAGPAIADFVPAFIGYGAGALGLVIGAVTIGVHAAQSSDAEDLAQGRTCKRTDPAASGCSDIVDAQDTADLTGNVSTAFFVIGGAGVAAGTGLLLWTLLRPRGASEVALVPFTGPDGTGLVVWGTF